MGLFIFSVLVALSVSGFCSLIESVLLSLSPGDIAQISAKHPRIAQIWVRFKSNIDRPIAVILLLNTTAHTIGASVAGSSFAEMWGTKWIWVFSLGFTFLMLQYTEILPKSIGVRFNRRLAVLFARPLDWSVRFFSPIISIVRFFNRPFEPRSRQSDKHSTVEEIALMAALAKQSHLIGSQQEQIIVGATKLSGTRVSNVMIPFDEVVVLSSRMSLWEAIEIAHVDAHTRFPVCNGEDRNDIIGYVNFKEIISHQRFNPQATEFNEIIRPISFVLPEESASDLLRRFTFQHEHIAIVRDKSGVCLGMVALEDIVEELVGEIEDEFDRLPRGAHVLKGGVLVLGGGCPMREVRELVERQLQVVLLPPSRKPHPSDNRSLAYWLEESLKHVPRRGDGYECDGVRFVVRRIRRKRVFDVLIQKAR
ncbi:MAG: CNNM domain-containing protein [Planctomycetia bacterium]|nr:CNNM domain-containing protein [Planctomycetia bacterium]